MKLKYIAAAATLTILLPFAASALTADDIQQQIATLLHQIAQLQEQLKSIKPDPVACTQEARQCPDGSWVGRSGPNCEFASCEGLRPLPPPRCPDIKRVLYRGVSGDDVSSLQEFLGVSVTGYFGTVTEAAVQKAQAQEGIATAGTPGTTGYGAVGSKTRAWILRRCGGGGNEEKFKASPTSGNAPLNVRFSYNLGTIGDSKSYSVDFGDGTSGSMNNAAWDAKCGAPGCVDSWSISHIYTSNGTYTARLFLQPVFSCPANADCNTPARQQIGTATVTVGSTNGSTSVKVYSPSQGQNIAQGDTLKISWDSQNAPAGSAVSLWLMKKSEKPVLCPAIYPPDPNCGWDNLGLVAGNQNTSGSYAWGVPNSPPPTPICGGGSSAFDCILQYGANMPIGCPLDTPAVCGNNVTIGSYKIVAKVYTPANACLGGLCMQINPATYLASSESGVFTIGGERKPDSKFSASPTSGSAPLTVTFRGPCAWNTTLEYGDGTSDVWTSCLGSDVGSYGQEVTKTHTYYSSGTWGAVLRQETCAYLMNQAASASLATSPVNPCVKTLGYASIKVGGPTSFGAPSISGLDAPTSLAVGQSGTWTVHASVPNQPNSQLSYSVQWGDEAGPLLGAMQMPAPASIKTSATFTHSYQAAGTYSPTFIVSNNSGSAKTSASVTVSGSTNGTPAVSILSPNGGQTYVMNDNIPVSWSISGVSQSDINSGKYAISLELLTPASSHDRPVQSGTELSSFGSASGYSNKLVSSSQGSITMTAPSMRWETGYGTNVAEEYVVRAVLGIKDPTVCPPGSYPQPPTASGFLGKILGFFLPQIAQAEVVLPCSGYRVVASDTSDASFMIRQPLITGSVSLDNVSQTVKVHVTATLPNDCISFTLGSNPAPSGILGKVTLEEHRATKTGCSSSDPSYSITRDYTFPYHTYSFLSGNSSGIITLNVAAPWSASDITSYLADGYTFSIPKRQ